MATEPVLAVLRSIDATLKELLALSKQRRSNGMDRHTPKPAGEVATDQDLDGQHGNPELRFDPRDWTGPSYKGSRFSECPAELLDMVAEVFEYFATKADEAGEKTDAGVPKSKYKRADAARARGWALRIRSGKHTPAPREDAGWGGGGFG